MAFKEDLSVFVSTGGFATLVKVGGVDVKANYSNGSDPSSIGSAGFDATAPGLVCLTADLPPDTKQGTSVIADSVNYKIAEIHHDGTGMTVIALKK